MDSRRETQPEPVKLEDQAGYIDPTLAELQRIETGGPVKRTDFGLMPAPIRYFGYFFFTAAALMLIIGLILQWIRPR